MKKETLKSFYLTYRFYIFPSVVGFCCLLLIIFILLPQALKLLSNQTEEGNAVKKTLLLEAKADELATYDEADLKKSVELALNVLPTDKDFANSIGLLQQIANSSAFIVNSIQIGQSASTVGGQQSYSINIEAEGSKSLVGTLIKNIENSQRVMKVVSVDISSGKRSDSVVIALGVEVLYSSSLASAQPADAPLPKLSEKDQQLISRLTQVTQNNTVAPSGGVSLKGKSDLFD